MSGCGCGSYGRSGRQVARSGFPAELANYLGSSNSPRITRFSYSVTTVESIPYQARPAQRYPSNSSNYLTYDDDDDSDDTLSPSFLSRSSRNSSRSCFGNQSLASVSSSSGRPSRIASSTLMNPYDSYSSGYGCNR